MAKAAPFDQIEQIRTFNRFYTHRLGTLNEGLLDQPLTLTQARVLWELAQEEGGSASDLCRRLDLDPSYLSRILGDYLERGWVERTTSAGDARRWKLALTTEGQRAFVPLDQASRRQIEGWLSRLTEAERELLAEAMGTVQRLLGSKVERPAPRIVIREHRPGDLGWVVERQARIYAAEYGWNQEFEALVAEISAKFLRRHDPERERCWIGEVDGRRMGSVTLVAKSRTVAQLRMLFVDAEGRGLGLGRQLTGECLAFARKAGYRKVILWTNDCLDAARRIYQAAGFRLTQSECHHSFGHDLVGQFWELKISPSPAPPAVLR